MKFLDELLDKIDNYFAGKKESEKSLMIFGVAAIVGYFAYSVLLPICEDRYNATESEKNSLLKTLNEQKSYMQSITINGDKNGKVNSIISDINRKKVEIGEMMERTKVIDGSMVKLSDMIFDPKSWSLFLNSISTIANAHKVTILKIDNKYTDSNSSNFGHVLKIKVKSEGAFNNVMLFINELEQNRLATDVYKSNFTTSQERGKVISDLNISVWGINKNE